MENTVKTLIFQRFYDIINTVKKKEKYWEMTKENIELDYEKIIAEKEKLITELVAKNEKLEQDLFNTQLQFSNFVRNRFGMKKESFTSKQECSDTQLSLFDSTTPEEEKEEIKANIEKITVSSKKKNTRKKEVSGLKKNIIKKIKNTKKEYLVDENETCHICNSKLVHVAQNAPRTEVIFVPAHFELVHHVTHTYKCSCCGTDKSENEKSVFKATKAPRTLFSNSFASASLVTEVLYNKFLMGTPFYRQEQFFDEQGLVLPRNMMANWAIKSSEYYFSALVDLMLKNMKNECEILHCDETTIQCNKEPGKAANSKSYMWVVCSGETEEKQSVVFKYASTRNAEFAEKLLDGFNGNLCTDAYAAYNNVSCKTHSGCYAHVRRKFFESIPNIPGADITKHDGYIGVNFCNKLFELEREIAESSDEDKLNTRKTKHKQVFEAFFDWVEKLASKTIVNKKLKEALTYAINQKEELSVFIDNVKVPLSNNRAERAIRPFAIHRKNWLFSDTQKGAHANANIYSIVESAKQNNLHVYKYIKYLLDELPQLDNLTEESLEKYLPSSKTLPKEILNCDEEYEEVEHAQENS